MKPTPLASFPRFALAALLTGALLMVIFVVLVLRFRTELRAEIRQRMIERDAAVLFPVARQQIEKARIESKAEPNPRALLYALLSLAPSYQTARQDGLIAMSIFDADGSALEYVPTSQLFVELPVEDYIHLLGGQPISRFHPEFSLDRLFAGVAPDQRTSPVLEILLPLRETVGAAPIGFVRYHLDARSLAGELAAIDRRIHRHTTATLAIGLALIALVVMAASFVLRRAQRTIAERNERLTRTNFELTLSTKASALGQITTHLIHGLQGPVAGLRAAVASGGEADWPTAAAYTERLQSLIQETVGLLGDTRTQATYELTGRELVDTIRARNQPLAVEKGVRLSVRDNFHHSLDSHRGSLLCLIATNLVENAVAATPRGRLVDVSLDNGDGHLTVLVTDEGAGLPDSIRKSLFEPGRTTKPGGTGLGLAISRLLARQIGGELSLARSDAAGTTFKLRLPL